MCRREINQGREEEVDMELAKEEPTSPSSGNNILRV